MRSPPPLGSGDRHRALKALLDRLRQTSRLLRLSFPHDDAPADALMVANRLEAYEALGRDFRFTVEVLSNRPDIAMKDVMGKMVAIELTREDGSTRWFNGHAFEFRFVDNDGGFCRYQLVLLPRLAFLRHRKDNYLFHGKTLEQQTRLIFDDYYLRDWKISNLGVDEPMTDACQFDESDYNYLHRRWEAKGWHYRYEHREDGHTLILCGDNPWCPPIDGDGSITWRGESGGPEPGLRRFSPLRKIASNHFTAASYDFKKASPYLMDLPTLNKQGICPPMETYEYIGAHGFQGTHTARRNDLARLRMEEIEAGAKRFDAEGDDDHAQCGRWFSLIGHEGWFSLGKELGDNNFVILEAEHDITNNYEKNPGNSAPMAAGYHCKLVCMRRKIPWRPGRGLNSRTTRIDTPQTATVVGPKGEQIHTDKHGRVRLQFHWDREGKDDEHSSAWVRVATNWAGGENGLSSLPRIGSEVIVQWLGGNPDRPIVTGAVHNASRMPPWALPAQKALSGLRSRELGARRSNHLVLDDTAGRIQAQLKSDHQTSQLSLGHICRIEDNAGRKDLRGQGFELRSDGHGALRAGQGLLISTEPRPNAQAHITDMAETIDGLKQAQALHNHLSATAQQAQAHLVGDQDKVIDALHVQVAELKGHGGQPDAGHFPEFQQPHLVIASPVGIQTQTNGSTHSASGEHHASTSGGHTSVSAGGSFLLSVREAVRLFACNAGMKLVAAASDIDITALKNSIHVLAKLDITQTANRITISAKEEVVINGGGSYTRWNAGSIEGGTNGVWRMKAAKHWMEGPDNAPTAALPEPITPEELTRTFSLAVVLRTHPVGGRPMANEPYTLYKGAAKVEDGVTDAHGQLIIADHEKGTAEYTVKLSNGHEIVLPVRERLMAGDEQLASRGFRAADGEADDRLRHQRSAEDD